VPQLSPPFWCHALTAAIILALALVMPPWAAALVVAAVYLAIAGALALRGRTQVQAATPFLPSGRCEPSPT